MKVTNLNGTPVLGKEIAFNSIAPDGTRSFLGTSTTGSDGRAKIGYTLGMQSGKNYLIEASCSECEPRTVTFTANTAKVNIKLSADPTEVVPSGTTGNNVSLLTAEVSDQFGPFPDYPLEFERKFEPKGHPHQSVPLPEVLKGSVTPSCVTIANGECNAAYGASEVAGTALILARSAWEEENKSNELKLPVQIQLSPLGTSAAYRLTGKTPEHGDNHNGTASTLIRMILIANEYLDTTDYTLGINDMSLPWGGMFDICGTWNPADTCSNAPSGGHDWHREGMRSLSSSREASPF